MIAIFAMLYLAVVPAMCVGMGIRVSLVTRYRSRLLDLIGVAAAADLAGGRREFEWRFVTFEAVPYDAMVLQFWRPLKSFYPDMSFTEAA